MEDLAVGELPNREPGIARSDAATDEIREKLRNQVIRGDCLEVMKTMPANIIDCTITSPPYNKGNKMCYNSYDDAVPWDKYIAEQILVLEELYRITKPGGHLWYVHKVQHFECNMYHPIDWIAKSSWKIQNEIVWNRRYTINCNPYRFRPLDERIYWLHKPGPEAFKLNPAVSIWGSIWHTPDDRNGALKIFRHPATFSLYLVLSILHAMSLPTGSLVFDPYGGTGTTAKASQVSNHHYLTIDIDREYVKTINRRLKTSIETDEYWIMVVMKQIATETLDLSQHTSFHDLDQLLLGEPWEMPKIRSHEEKRQQALKYYYRKKTIYYRKNPKPQSEITRKHGNYRYSAKVRPDLPRYLVKNPEKRSAYQNLWAARYRITKGYGKLKLNSIS